MDQTLDCIILAKHHETERKRIEECLADKGNHEVIIDRHRLEFNGDSRYVTITRLLRMFRSLVKSADAVCHMRR